jgi:hypothetical protein
MIRLGLYRSLPHREGGGGTGNVTDAKQELRRQLRFVRRNTELIGNLVRIRAGLPIDPEAASRLRRCRIRLRAAHTAMVTHKSSCERPKEANPTARAEGASARTASPASKPVILSEAKDLQFAMVTHNSSREATNGSESRTSRRRRICRDGPVPRHRRDHLGGKSRSCARSSATIVAAAARASSERSGGNEIAPTRAWPPPP